ncbi:MAG TPA: ATP-binding protein [Cellulomonas sp.]
MTTPRHQRPVPRVGRLPDVRPLDRLRSIKIKLGVLVAATVFLAAMLTWLGLNRSLGPSRTFPIVIVLALVVTQLLARGMTSPLREMTSAARAMAAGDYSRRVRATSRDEVGQLAVAFNRMADDLEQADTLRREMVANVSHELRTPVTALQAQLENIVDGVSDADPETMRTALAQTQRLSKLVATLLDLSRIEAGAVELTVADVPVQEFLAEAAAEARLIGASKDLTFPVLVEPANLTVPADRERLHQVVANLVQNAVRHSPRGAPVRLEAHRSGGWVRIDVIDRGPGIAADQRERVFERFARGNTPAVTGQISTGGTGLGLSIVRWAVTLHGGTVEVADTESGCTMRVMLPSRRSTRTAPGLF